MSAINGYKTYIVCVITLLYAAVSYWNHSMDQNAAMEMALAAIGAATIRHGISNSQGN